VPALLAAARDADHRLSGNRQLNSVPRDRLGKLRIGMVLKLRCWGKMAGSL